LEADNVLEAGKLWPWLRFGRPSATPDTDSRSRLRPLELWLLSNNDPSSVADSTPVTPVEVCWTCRVSRPLESLCALEEVAQRDAEASMAGTLRSLTTSEKSPLVSALLE
jgi:hypothetical protein